MSITAQLHDGTELEFPDGTDPQVIQATVKKHLSANWQPRDALETASNLPGSVFDQFKGLANAAIHPIDTAQSVLDVANGGLQKVLPDSVNEFMHKVSPGTVNNPSKADAFAEYYKNRFGSEKGFHDAVTQDPAGVMMDASMLLGIGGATRIPVLSEKMAKAAVAVNPIALPLKGAAAGLRTGSEIIDSQFGAGKAAKILANELRGSTIPTQAPSLIPENADLSVGPPVPKFGYVPGAKPTAGMITDDPNILRLEMNARNRNPVKFFPRDANNITAINNLLLDKAIPDAEAWKMQEAVNDTTKPLRENAINIIKNRARTGSGGNGYNFGQTPQHAEPLVRYLQTLANSPNSGKKALYDLSSKYVKNPSPDNLYDLRKDLSDKLSLKPNATLDDASNAVVNNRRIATVLKNKIDEGFNSAVGDKWENYLNTHKEGMQPIEQGRAFQNILDKFEHTPKLAGTETPIFTPSKFSKAVDDETYFNAGKSGDYQKVGPTERKQLEDATRLLEAMQGAKKGITSVEGSPTATFLANMAKTSIDHASGSTTARLVVSLLKGLGESRGQRILDDAILNPEKLQPILDKYHASRK